MASSKLYPDYRVNRLNGHASYYLIASPTHCVEFVEERKAGNEFGFLIRTLKSRPAVKDREEWSSRMDKAAWFAEVKGSMLAHLECAMELVALCDSVRVLNRKPSHGDYRRAAPEAEQIFDSAKRANARAMLIQSGEAEDAADAIRLLGQDVRR